jgi:trigger factor
MQVTVEKLSPVLVELQVEVPADQVRTEVERAYSALARTARVRGFRPGKAPRAVLAHIFGGRVHQEVAQKLMDETLGKAIADQQLQQLTQPAIAPAELRPEEAFSYKARFEVRPDIASVTWEGLEAKRPPTTATDAMIDAEIADLRRQHSTLQTPDPERPAKAGDVGTVSFFVEVEGRAEPSKTEEIEIEIGAGEVMPEIEQAVTGMRPAETKDVALAYPAQHQSAELRGKKATFHLTLKDLKERILPEVDDELAKDCGEESLAALRASVKTRIERELKQRADDSVAEQLVFELCKANAVPVPPSLIEQQAQQTERDLVATGRRQGQRVDLNADLKARVRADAEMKVRAGLLMAEIARLKQVQVTDEDVEKGYAELAEQTGKNVAKVKAEHRDPKKREQLLAMILEDKILDILEGAAKITDATA